MDQPTTSEASEEIQEIGPDNIGKETTTMLQRIIWKLKLDQNSTTKSIPLSDPVARTARYTGMNKTNIEKILAFGDSIKFDHMELNRKIIHNALMDMYHIEKFIPTVTELFNLLNEKLPIYVNLDSFTKILIKMGYVFYKFPRRKTLHVMEKKSVTFERYRYLKSIQKCRENNAPVVYVGFVSFTNRRTFLDWQRTSQTESKDIVGHVLFTATCESIANIKSMPAGSPDKLKTYIKNWLSEIIALQKVPLGSAIVLEDSELFNETLIEVPTWRSVKADMVEWLEEHNVPCDIHMQKYELLNLIESCTDTKENTFVIDNLFKDSKYTILRLPQCINGLSIVSLIIRYVNDNDTQDVKDSACRTNASAILRDVPESLLEITSNWMISEEKKQLQDDIELDNILDELVRKMKKSKINEETNDDDVTLPTFSDSD